MIFAICSLISTYIVCRLCQEITKREAELRALRKQRRKEK